ncbi:MAG: VWA domain-containing protein [Bacteroidota bacterium]
MFRLENPEYLWLLLCIPVLLFLFGMYWRGRKRALARFADRDLLDRLAPGLSQRRPWTKFLLLLLAIPFLALAYANPQWSTQREEIKRRGIDLIIALDISRSMLAEDVQPSRIERSRYFASNLVDELAGNNIGVELFTCTALMQSPLMTDYAFVKTVLTTAAPYQIGAQGTNIGEAIEVAEENYREESANHRALIIISDGEDHDGSGANAAARAHDNGLLIYTVGVGKESGSTMPLTLDNGRRDFVRTRGGSPASTVANFDNLSAIADAGGGKYYPLSSDSEALAAALRSQIDQIEKLEFESQSFSSYDSFFYYFLAPGVLLLFLEFLVGSRDRRKAKVYEV